MPQLMLHHVSILTSDVERSLAFYRDILGLKPLPRPDFPIGGSWLACGDRQVHLVQHPAGTYRSGEIDNNDTTSRCVPMTSRARCSSSRRMASLSTRRRALRRGS